MDHWTIGRIDTYDHEYFKTDNEPVAPLVLHGFVGGDNHLSSGDPHARLPCLFHKKKYMDYTKFYYSNKQ